MRKYRIMELNHLFYPQEKHWFEWMYIDNMSGKIIWHDSNKHHSKCESFDYAKRCIERRKDWLENGGIKPIYHEIK